MSRREVTVAVGEGYRVVVEGGALAEIGRLVAGATPTRRVVVVTNPTVAALYADSVRTALETELGGGHAVVVVEIPDGEQFKTLATLEPIYDAVLDGGADREVVVVALGGGVVGDVAGFAAATVLRGVRLVQVPTTLLAQVDSSVGGKTGVNRSQGKNLVGAFHQPALVVADPVVLASLPDREYRAGLAEVVKYGVILDRALFAKLEDEAAALAARDVAVLTDVVARSVELKAAVVVEDEREGGLRRILNFGHTVGHALEKLTGYSQLLHGEAVAIGMAVAMRLSAGRGAATVADADRVATLLDRLDLPTEIPAGIDAAAIQEAVGFDKKRTGETVAFIVAEGIGRCRVEALAPAEIGAAMVAEGERP